MTGGRCEKHDNWHAECRRCLEEAAYARGVADERARVVADLRTRASYRSVTAFEKAILGACADYYDRGEHEEAT